MATPSLPLLSGGSMPVLSVGLYMVAREDVKTVIDGALAAGVRNFDLASFYDNEAECGAALRSWLAQGHDRSEVYITTKVWTTDLGSPEDAVRSAEISIDELGLGPVDCVMVHWPMPGKHVAAYVGLESLVRSGKAKALGLSNYSPGDFDELMKSATIKPEANTFENNPLLYRKEWVDFFQQQKIAVIAYKPFQRGGPVMTNETVTAICQKTGKSPAQVLLRWNIEKGNAVAFKSNSPQRLAENAAVFDFELSAEDVAALDALTTEEAKEKAMEHWEKRRNGTTAPWGDGLRPESRRVEEG